ncbi:hypothetical protein PR202_gb12353 [Eleusine coracana subsp. coracana]|uniref:J domain-containing protein n=1 Tax=Eleusine coracana subsp. coracana TaxID=191504 RepID=A0AAV5EP48_ELECO|nr:hypothetical protein PR202_gb12353 [Eleusine coracana subsp. coracana]
MEISMTLASRRASEQPSGGGGAGERARKRQRAGEGSDRRRVRESKHAVSRASDQPSGGGGSVRGSQEAAAHAWNPSPLRPPLSAPSSPFSLDVRAAALASPGDALSALLPQRESSPSARDEGGPRPPAAPTSTARNHVFAAFGKGSFAKAATGRSEKDYYATLNIRHDATLQEVNAAYRTLAHKRSRIQWSEGYHCVDIVLQRFQDLRADF